MRMILKYVVRITIFVYWNGAWNLVLWGWTQNKKTTQNVLIFTAPPLRSCIEDINEDLLTRSYHRKSKTPKKDQSHWFISCRLIFARFLVKASVQNLNKTRITFWAAGSHNTLNEKADRKCQESKKNKKKKTPPKNPIELKISMGVDYFYSLNLSSMSWCYFSKNFFWLSFL